jgi:hypothetical protein
MPGLLIDAGGRNPFEGVPENLGLPRSAEGLSRPVPPLPSAGTSDSIHCEEQRFPKGRKMNGNAKGGRQWETKAAKRTKRRTGNKRKSNTQKI